MTATARFLPCPPCSQCRQWCRLPSSCAPLFLCTTAALLRPASHAVLQRRAAAAAEHRNAAPPLQLFKTPHQERRGCQQIDSMLEQTRSSSIRAPLRASGAASAWTTRRLGCECRCAILSASIKCPIQGHYGARRAAAGGEWGDGGWPAQWTGKQHSGRETGQRARARRQAWTAPAACMQNRTA